MKLLGHVDEATHDRICGWVVDQDNPAVALDIQIVVDGMRLTTIRADIDRPGLAAVLPDGATEQHQFDYRFSPRLSRNRPHVIEVFTQENRTLLPNGRWSLPRAPETSSGLLPVLVTSTGRAGTTMLMHEFAGQPAIVVADSYPYEIKLANYYAAALKVLTYARDRTDQDSDEFAVIAVKHLRAVPNPWNQPELHHVLGGQHLARLFRDVVPARLQALFRSLLQEFYGTIATNQNKDNARYFAEKTVLNLDARHAMMDFVGDHRELILIRDPRDYLCSAQSFWKKTVSTSIETLRSDIAAIEAIRQEASPSSLFIRYEDLVLQPTPTRERILTFLGLDPAEAIPVSNDEDLLRRHATTSDPAASIGRWKHDLSADDAAACQQYFEPFMASFGYLS